MWVRLWRWLTKKDLNGRRTNRNILLVHLYSEEDGTRTFVLTDYPQCYVTEIVVHEDEKIVSLPSSTGTLEIRGSVDEEIQQIRLIYTGSKEEWNAQRR